MIHYETFRMTEPNPVFEENYKDYLRQLDGIHMSRWASVLNIAVDEKRITAQIPFFQAMHRVSPAGVAYNRCRRPDYGTCLMLLKYLLICPLQTSWEEDWITYRDFADSGQAQNAGLADYAATTLSR